MRIGRFSEVFPPIPVVESKDYGSSGIVGDSIHVGRLHTVAFLITFGALTGNSILSFYQGATNAALTTQIAFNYRLSAADYKTAATTQGSNADSYGALTAVAATGLTLTATNFDHRLVVVEFDGVDLAAGFPWLTLNIDNTATVMNVGVIALPRLRYTGNLPPTVL